MMQRWMTIALLGATLAGCQIDREPAAAEADESRDSAALAQLDPPAVCSAKAPDPVKWDGKPHAVAELHNVWVYMPPDKNGIITTALVDTDGAVVKNVYTLDRSQLALFIGFDPYSQGSFPGHPNPPPPVMPAAWIFYAQHTREAIDQANQDLKSCNANGNF